MTAPAVVVSGALGVAVGAALGAAACFALAAVLQQESTQSVSSDRSLSLRLLVDLLHRREWLTGVGFLLAGYGLQALALAFGPVALVQPIVVTELAFAIPLAILRHHHRAGSREWAGITCVIGGLVIFLLVASPSTGMASAGAEDWLSSLVPVGVVALAMISVGSRLSGPRRAMALGAAAGLGFGVMSVLTKAVTNRLSVDLGHAFASWEIYVTIVVGVVALVVSQSAYQAGPLAYSMPFVGVLEPLVAVLIGDTVLGEQIRLSGPLLAVEVLAAAIASVGIVILTTSRLVLSIYEEG